MATSPNDKLTKSLTQRLKGAMDTTEIRNLAKTINALQQGGLSIDDVFPIGVVVSPDGVAIRGHLPADKIDQLGALIPMVPTIRDIRVFPRGIVIPDRFRVHFNVGR